ncbi:MAG: hypothetical protein IPO53_02670 [Chitinophagaceae bacterium]|nr:hypothetical protein [Chitinophagaceae bacterium]
MQTFCTIITASHLPFAKVLHASLQKQVPGTLLQVLVVDENNFSSENFTIHTIDSLANSHYFQDIEKRYAHTNPDHFRWALKPVFIGFLLQNGFSKVLFADPDLYFVNNFSFLFEELNRNNILLTPHSPNINPVENEDSLFFSNAAGYLMLVLSGLIKVEKQLLTGGPECVIIKLKIVKSLAYMMIKSI